GPPAPCARRGPPLRRSRSGSRSASGAAGAPPRASAPGRSRPSASAPVGPDRRRSRPRRAAPRSRRAAGPSWASQPVLAPLCAVVWAASPIFGPRKTYFFRAQSVAMASGRRLAALGGLVALLAPVAAQASAPSSAGQLARALRAPAIAPG